MKKYISASWLLLLVALVSVSLTGCKQEGCTDVNAINYDPKADEDDGSCEFATAALMMHWHSDWGTAGDLALNTDYTLMNGRTVNFSHFSFYMSNFRLVDADGNETALDGIYRQWTPATEMMSLGNVSVGSYSALKFDLGVDSTSNFGDPAQWPDDHALSSSNPNHSHWSWASGYLFFRAEGNVDGSDPMSGTIDSTLEWHVGTMSSLRTVTITSDVSIAEGATGMYHVDLNPMSIFHNLDMTMDSDRVTHTGDNPDLATHLANHLQSAITAQ